MKEYLVKRTESNGITFKELTDLIKCIQNPANITIQVIVLSKGAKCRRKEIWNI